MTMDARGRTARSPMALAAASIIRAARVQTPKAAVLVERMAPWVNRLYDADTVSTWVTGKVVPPADALLAAAKAVNLSIDLWLYDPSPPVSFNRQWEAESAINQRPCPFCGAQAHLFVDYRGWSDRSVPVRLLHYALCSGCGARGGCSESPEEAVRYWVGAKATQSPETAELDAYMREGRL